MLIGHEGHPEVEGTMGQYDNHDGGIYLVENVEDIAKLSLRDDEDITFMTQTTLSIDDTAEVIEALKENIRQFKDCVKMIFVMQQLIANRQCVSWLRSLIWCLSWDPKNSSNSNRLAELASRMGVISKLIDDKVTSIQSG